MKILHIVPSYKPAFIYGGPIESVSKLCEGLVQEGHQVDVFTTTANGKEELEVVPNQPTAVDGVNVIYFKRITKDPTHVSPALWSHLISNVKSYDIVHIQSWWNILVIVAAWICHFKKVKVVISPRGMLSPYVMKSGKWKAKKFIHTIIGRRVLKKSWFHATSPAENTECLELIKGWKGFVLPNLITLPVIPLERRDNDIFTLIFMSRIHPKKGIELLFDAISKIKTPIRLQIAGSGEQAYVKQLKRLARELSITDRIEWQGWVDREKKFLSLRDADLFILLSHNENFANVVVESLHMNTPVFLSEGVGLSTFVQENNLGWVTPLIMESIVSSLEEAIASEDKIGYIRKEGRNLIELNFSAVKLIKSYVEEYQRIIDTK